MMDRFLLDEDMPQLQGEELAGLLITVEMRRTRIRRPPPAP
jgi:hypothetical protein